MFLPSSYLPSSFQGKLFWSAIMFMPMWPFLDVSCPWISLLPRLLQDRLVDFHVQHVPANEKILEKAWAGENLTPVITRYGHHSEIEVLEIIREHPFSSVLIKSFVSADGVTSILEDFKATTASKIYTLVNDSHSTHQRLGGLFSSGLHADGNAWSDFQSGRRRLVKGELSGIWNGSSKDTYGSFVPVGEGSMHTLINWTSRSYTPDTSFFGWFSRKVVTTPLHSNWPADTLGLQLAGRKQWLMIDPFDMKAALQKQNAPLFSSGTGGVFYPNLRVDSHLRSSMKIATTEPGDLLYFPPYAAHAVVSDAGLNVMTALRLGAPRKALTIHPWKTSQALSYIGVNRVYQRVRYALGLNKYKAQVWHLEQPKWFDNGVQLKSWSPTYDDAELERLLEKL